MPDLTKLFKEHEHVLSSADLQLFKDLIDGKVNPQSAAISLTKDIDMILLISTPLLSTVVWTLQ